MGLSQDSLCVVGATPVVAPTDDPAPAKKRLGDMIGAFASITTAAYIRGVKKDHWERFNRKLWQRNYWEHIIRDTDAYHRIAPYILDNAKNWKQGSFK